MRRAGGGGRRQGYTISFAEDMRESRSFKAVSNESSRV